MWFIVQKVLMKVILKGLIGDKNSKKEALLQILGAAI